MQLQNRFKDIDKQRVWLDHAFCVLCNSNQGCSAHHIMGCDNHEDSSILNSSMLCADHHRYADGHNVSDGKFQAELLKITMIQVLKSEYIFTDLDKEFLMKHKEKYLR
jgi:hypothetical protein